MILEENEAFPSWAQEAVQHRTAFQRKRQRDPARFYPFLPPCRNRVLLVTDDRLDFSDADLGFSVVVRTLLDTPGGYVQHEITLAHIDAVETTQMMPEERIRQRISKFRFDNPKHFAPDMYDVVMLLGFAGAFVDGIDSPDADHQRQGTLAHTELAILVQFMNGGGGLIATGDHGDLGRALCYTVPRVRNMRLWTSTSDQNEFDEVSMDGAHRNDTNRGSLFNHQSDDVPQVIEPKLYATGWALREFYPHPLLCGPRGIIRVMPDHPHEGQCIEPTDATLRLDDIHGGPEYPDAEDEGTKPLPEIISANRVPTGNTSPLGGVPKDPTVAHDFGGICAYDGHRAGVGRVVTDSTWHHFLNINLVGIHDGSAQQEALFRGFLTLSGIPVLEEIRAYYRNLFVWTARPETLRCINLRLVWSALFDQRVMEAVLSTTRVSLSDLRPRVLRLIGAHARDALGQVAGQCQVLDLVQDLVLKAASPGVARQFDPWRQEDGPAKPVPEWFDGSPLLDIVLGGMLVGVREEFGTPTADETRALDMDQLAAAVSRGGTTALHLALRSITEEYEGVAEWITRARDELAGAEG